MAAQKAWLQPEVMATCAGVTCPHRRRPLRGQFLAQRGQAEHGAVEMRGRVADQRVGHGTGERRGRRVDRGGLAEVDERLLRREGLRSAIQRRASMTGGGKV
jgi:hypothetical protein